MEFAFDQRLCTAAEVQALLRLTFKSDSDLKRAFAEHDLLTFYRQYLNSVSYPNLSQHALRFIALFGSTYCCEQFIQQ